MLAHPPAPPLLSPAMMHSRLLSPANHCHLSPYYCHSSSINSENEHSVLVYVHAVQSVYRGQHQTPSRNRKRDRALKKDYQRYIRQRRIPRHSLLYVKISPWHRVFNSGDPQAMITLTGFDMESFMYICALFCPLYNDYSPFIDENRYIVKKKTKRGGPRLMKAEDCLGLVVLAWTHTQGCLMSLQLIFGMTMTPVAKYLQFACRILVVVLINNDMAKIEMPMGEEYRSMIAVRHPALRDVWGTMDGLKVRIESAADFFAQWMFYNGWKSDHFVSAVLCFAPDGTIPAAFFNVPGMLQVTFFGVLWFKMWFGTA
jgi:hypothetical protein